MANFKPAKIIRRTNAEPLSDILKLFVATNRLGYGLFNQEVFKAWDEASGMGRYSTNKYYREGTLHVTITSSLVRSQLSFQLDSILDSLNAILDKSGTVEMSGIKERVSKISLH